MSKLLTYLYVHSYTTIKAPESWSRYIKYCITHKRLPQVKVLQRILAMNKIIKSFKDG